MRARLAFAVPAVSLAVVACNDPDISDHPTFNQETDDDHESDIVSVETPVPPGAVVACDDLLHAADVAALMDEETVTIKDDSATDPDATSVCRIHRDGEPPSRAVQERRSEKTGLLGVLPGDEYCTIEAHCSAPNSVERLVEQCEKQGDTVNEELGVPACVHRSQRGPRWAYTYKVYDAETECTFRVLGGPSVTDEELVRRCTDVALTTIAPENIESYER